MDATNVIIAGGCHCKSVRYECRGPGSFRGLCYCRTCQMISGGAGNLFMAVDAQTFQFTSGNPRSFTNNEHPWRPTRHFCEICGVHLTARSERAPSAVLIKGALSMTRAFSKARKWSHGLRRSRSFTCCHPMYPPIRKFPARPHLAL